MAVAFLGITEHCLEVGIVRANSTDIIHLRAGRKIGAVNAIQPETAWAWAVSRLERRSII